MLSGLDRPDWPGLRHAHGPAADVPAALRALAIGGTTQANRALALLTDALCPEGRLYPATVAAVPFLAELALRPGPRVPGVLRLLHDITAPGCDAILEAPLETDAYYALSSPPDPALPVAAAEPDGRDHRTVADCHAAVAATLADLLPLLDHADPRVAGAMVMLLGNFPDRAQDSAPRIAALLEARPDTGLHRAGLLAMGRLGRSVEGGPMDGQLQRWLAPHHPLLLRAEAAAAMTGQTPARREVLLLALADAETLRARDRALDPQAGDTVTRVARALARWRGTPAERQETVLAFLGALQTGPGPDTSTEQLIRATLAALASGGPVSGLYRGRRRSDLTELDRQALRAIERHGDWDSPGFVALLQRAGLPATAPDLQRFATAPGPLARLLRR